MSHISQVHSPFLYLHNYSISSCHIQLLFSPLSICDPRTCSDWRKSEFRCVGVPSRSAAGLSLHAVVLKQSRYLIRLETDDSHGPERAFVRLVSK
jgi:hypothetical protein